MNDQNLMKFMNILIKPLISFFKLLIPQKYRFKVAKAILGDKKLFKLLGHKHIDKAEIEQKIKIFGNTSGVFEGKRTPRLIVSLTSYPERMNDLKYTLYSLFNQSLKPDEIVLWLSYEELSDKENSINDDILNFKKNGLAIKFCHNVKSYNKLIPTLKEYQNCIIVTADDDIYYDTNWLEKLYMAYQKNPQYIHCHRAHKILFDKNGKLKPYNLWEHKIDGKQAKPSFLNFFTGVGGVLYPPNSLYKDILNETLFLKLTPTSDDIWFWAMAVLQGTKTNVVNENINKLTYVNIEIELGLTAGNALNKINVILGKNDENLKNVFEFYNIYDKLLEKKY